MKYFYILFFIKSIMKRANIQNLTSLHDSKRRTPISFIENSLYCNKSLYLNPIFVEKIKYDYPEKDLNNLKPPEFNSIIEGMKNKYPIKDKLYKQLFDYVKANNILKFQELCLEYPYLNFNTQNKNNETLLMTSIEYDSEEIFDKLVEYDTDIDFEIEENITPLTHSIYLKSLKYVKKLINLNVNINTPLGDKNYPIHLAIKFKAYEIIEYFLTFNIKLNILNSKGISPLIQTILLKDNISFDILIRYNQYTINNNLENIICLNFKSSSGETPLMYAIKNENEYVKNRLIQLECGVINLIEDSNETQNRCSTPYIQNFLINQTNKISPDENNWIFLNIDSELLEICENESSNDQFTSIITH